MDGGEKDSSAKGLQRIDHLVEAEPGQGYSRNCWRWRSLRHHRNLFPERDRHQVPVRALSWRRPAVPRFGGEAIPAPEQQSPEPLGAHQRPEIKKWWPVIKAAGIKAY